MKKILALVLAALMVLSMAACTTTGDNNGTGAQGSNNNKFTIKVWTPSGDQQEGNNWLVAMQEKFEELHPEYDITWDNSTMDEGKAGDAVIADVTASADVYMFANDQLGKLVNAGGLSKLVGDFAAQVNNDNIQFMIDTVTHTDDAIYGFPVTNNTWFLYYNTDVFSAEDVKSLDTMLTKGKVCLPITTGWNAGCFFLGTGCSLFGESGRDASVGISFGGENGYKAAKKMVELAAHDNVIEGGMDVDKLKQGEVAAVFSGSWDAEGLKASLGDKLGIAMLPKFDIDGTAYQMTAMSGSKCVGVNPNSNSVPGKQLACTEFAAFLASEEAQLARYTMRGVIPSHKNLKENEKIAADPVALAEINTITYASVIQSALPEMGNYWGPVETFGKQVASGDVDLTNYEKAVDDMNNTLNNPGL